MLSDLRYALRSFRRAPMLAVVALLSMMLGIGANTAIFSLLNQVLLRSMAVHEPDRLVVLKSNGQNYGRVWDDGTHTSFSYPMLGDVAKLDRVFSTVIGRFQVNASLAYKGRTERALAEMVSGEYFSGFGVNAMLGRTLTAEDNRTPGASPVIVLSYDTYRSRFGADPSVLGQTLLVNGHPMTVVGVAQPGFRGFQTGSLVDFFVPFMMANQVAPDWQEFTDRLSSWLQIVARLQPGVSREQAQAAVNTLYKSILAENLKLSAIRGERAKQEYLQKTVTLLDGSKGHSPLREQFTTPLLALMAMVGLVLLIACANVANLLLSRAAGRQKEIAIRLSVGATRRRLMSQLLTESLTLSITGGSLGLGLAVWTSRGMLGLLPMNDLTSGFTGSIDWRVLGFSAALSIFTGLLFGLIPAFQSTRPDLSTTLKDQASNTTGGADSVILRKALVVAQVALSLVLIIGAALFAKSLYNLRSVHTGFRTDHVMTFTIDPSLSTYSEPQVLQTYERIHRQLIALPGARSVSMAAMPLLAGSYMGMGLKVPGYTEKEGDDNSTLVNVVGHSFLTTVGTPVIAGRDFSEKDGAGAQHVSIVNQTLARKYFGMENPIGRHVVLQHRKKDYDTEIVGLIDDFKHGDLRDKPQPFVLMPYQQWVRTSSMTFYVRTERDPSSFGETLSRTVRMVDSNLPIYDLKSFDQQVGESVFLERAIAILATAFGGLATLLAAIGLYGVMAYSVSRRTRELGIRMALGATRGDVRSIILRQVMSMVLVGIVVAVPIAVVLSRLVKSQLYGMTGTDPVTIIACSTLLACIALVAGYVPAWRAMRIDPTVALRYE